MPEPLRQALRNGDPEALRRIMRELSEPLYRYAVPQLRDEQLAQDVVQQTFIRLWKHRRRLKPDGSLRTYCFFVATNLMRDTRRREDLRRRREAEGAEMRQQNERNELAAEAFEHAMNLPDELREVVLLRFAQGFTAAEAAEILGIPEGTVKTRQRSALEKLRDRLGAGMVSAVALPDVEGSLRAGAEASVNVPTSLCANVEALVMASVGAKTGISASVVVLALLLTAIGVTVGVTWVASNDDATSAGTALQAEDGLRADAKACSALATPSGNSDTGRLIEIPDPVASRASEPDELEDTALLTIRGRVVNESGEGIGGAVVSAFPFVETTMEVAGSRFADLGAGSTRLTDENSRFAGMSRVRMIELSFEPAADSVVCDAEGHFEITKLEAGPSTMGLRAFAVGYAVGESELFPAPEAVDQQTVEFRLVLKRLERCLHFRTDPPVSKPLSIELKVGRGLSEATRREETWCTPDGLHQVSLSRATIHALSFKAAGYREANVDVVDEGRSQVDAGTIRLDSGRIVSGVVESADGEPIEGAGIRISGRGFFYGTSAADGSFKFSGLDHDDLSLIVRHADYASTELSVAGSAENAIRLRLVMTRGVDVTGVVRFVGMTLPDDTGRVRVALFPEETDKAPWSAFIRDVGVPIDETYAFRFRHVAKGNYVLYVTDGDRVEGPVRLQVEDLPVQCSIEFAGPFKIGGVVLGFDGKPLANARITLRRTDVRNDVLRAGRTDAEGRYLFESNAPGQYMVFLEDHDTRLDAEFFKGRTFAVTDDVEFDIDLSAVPGNRVFGRVLVNGIAVFDDYGVFGTGLNIGVWRAKTAEDGSFEVRGLPPGDYQVVLSSTEYPDCSYRTMISFREWDGSADVSRELAGNTIKLSVTDAEGVLEQAVAALDPVVEGVPGVDLLTTLLGRLRGPQNVRDCRIKNVISGAYTLSIRAPGYATETRAIEIAGDTTMEFTLEKARSRAEMSFSGPPSVLTGALVTRVVSLDLPGEPLVYGELTRFKYQSTVQTPELHPGRYRLEAFGVNISPSSIEIAVARDEVVKVTLPLIRRSAVKVNVISADVPQNVIETAHVTVTNAATGLPVNVVGRMNPFLCGSFDSKFPRALWISPLPEGAYRIEVRLDGYEATTFEVVVESAKVHEVNLECKPR